MGIKVEAAAYSSIGGRKNNEDNFYFNGAFLKREQMDKGGKISALHAQPIQVYSVLDGMGGGEFGEYASFYAASRIKEYQDNSEHIDNSENLRSFLTDVSMGIDKISLEHGLKSGSCGSTIAMIIIGDSWYRTVHVGDSRVYLMRGGELMRLTKDQSEVQRMLDAGKITPEQAWSHPRKNVITHHLGMPLRTGVLHSIIGNRELLQAGDCFLICSDGVSDSLRDSEIQELIRSEHSAESIASMVTRYAKKRADEMGVESDNITSIVLKIREIADIGEAERRVKRLAFKRGIAAVCSILCALGTIAAAIMLIL